MKKINWGTSIVIAFVLFIGFILFFVIKASTNNDYSFDLVTEDYYQDELNVQNRIDRLENAKNLDQDLTIRKTETGIYIDFPKDIPSEDIKGTIYLYRPSNKILDLTIPLNLSEHAHFISYETLISGRWDIHVQWTALGESYLYQHSINY